LTKGVNISEGRQCTFKCCSDSRFYCLFLCATLTCSELSQTRTAIGKKNLITDKLNILIFIIHNTQHYIYFMGILKFQDDVRCCTASVLIMNQLHSYYGLWKTLFPYTSHYSSKSACKYDNCSTVNRVSVHKEKQ
jgi:hypothetical protein